MNRSTALGQSIVVIVSQFGLRDIPDSEVLPWLFVGVMNPLS